MPTELRNGRSVTPVRIVLKPSWGPTESPHGDTSAEPAAEEKMRPRRGDARDLSRLREAGRLPRGADKKTAAGRRSSARDAQGTGAARGEAALR